MKYCRIVILGASGLVGNELLKLLEKEDFPVSSLRLLGNRSIGKQIIFKGKNTEIEKVTEISFLNADIIFGCLGKEETAKYLPLIKKSGAYFIDNSSLMRLSEDAVLIIPEINGRLLKGDKKLIANPNCSTIITALALFPIVKRYRIKSAEVTSFQAVSGAGKGALEEFLDEARYYPPAFDEKPRFLPETLFGNIIPKIGHVTENLYTEEEMKMQNELRRIFDLPKLKVSCTSVRVPVIRCHSFSVRLSFYEEIPLENIAFLWEKAPYIKFCCPSYYPSPLKSEGSLMVSVGRLRKNLCDKKSINFFVCGDQLLRGAAGNSFLTAKLINEKLLNNAAKL